MTEFAVGDRVEKFTGDYQLAGTIRSVFKTSRGHVRVVVEHDPGFLHIYSPSYLRRASQAQAIDPQDSVVKCAVREYMNIKYPTNESDTRSS